MEYGSRKASPDVLKPRNIIYKILQKIKFTNSWITSTFTFRVPLHVSALSTISNDTILTMQANGHDTNVNVRCTFPIDVYLLIPFYFYLTISVVLWCADNGLSIIAG